MPMADFVRALSTGLLLMTAAAIAWVVNSFEIGILEYAYIIASAVGVATQWGIAMLVARTHDAVKRIESMQDPFE